MPRTIWRQYGRRLAVTALISLTLLSHTLGALELQWMDTLENVLYDTRLNLTMPGTMDERIVIIDVDEPSLARIGQWPWGRDRMAALVHELVHRQGVAALGIDAVFGESDRSSSLPELRRLAEGELKKDSALAGWISRNAARLDHDRQFAEALEVSPVALAFYLTSDRGGHRSGQLPRPLMHMEPPPPGLLHWSGYGAPIAQLAQAARAAGFINSYGGRDGVVRSAPLLASLDGDIYTSLAVATLQQAHSGSALHIGRVPGRPGGPLYRLLLTGGDAMPEPVFLQPLGTALVPYRGPGGPDGGSFRYISAADVLDGTLSPGELHGRIALLGFTSMGLMDLRTTPVGPAYPGVEVHASMISGMLDGTVPYVPDWVPGFHITQLLLLALALTVLMPRQRPLPTLGLGLGLLALVVGVNLALFLGGDLVLPLAEPLLLVITALTANLALGYFLESRARNELAHHFATYVPADLVRQMQRNPDDYGMQARAQELTVMFCDLIGFTAIAEAMEPTDLQQHLNEIFSSLGAVISQHYGTIDKYMGDCVMAFWGAPVPTAEHAQQAVEAALGMAAAIDRMAAERRALGLPVLTAGIGLNTGVVAVGNMGSDVRRAYTVIGDAVNLASRLEGITRPLGVNIIVSEDTHAQVHALPAGCLWQELGSVRVKGRSRPVVIYTVRSEGAGGGDESQLDDGTLGEELALWQAALADWRARNFGACWTKIRALRHQNADFSPYKLYEDSVISALRFPPPADKWDGTLEFTEK